ncbi:MAG TPA: diheme cytochrome c-553 [Polyangia bacterium]|nr:diheme cytochrome c-553 [Polyangia bacterium]
MPRTHLNHVRTFAAAASLTLVLTLGACAARRPAPVADATADRVARGRQLVSIGGCNDCHTPMKFDADLGMPVPDMTRMLSGHPEGAPDPASALGGHDIAVIGPTFTSFRLPFGVVYPANLTPDKDTGLGGWTEDMFLRAMRTGRHMGGNGRPILPPMPWMTLAQQSDADLKAIFAYLQSLPAMRNDVPAPKVPDGAMNAIAASYDKVLARMKGQAAR